jgi:hypothetical protein
MDIADINSCQLATFVGNQSIGVMDSAVSFSPSNNSAIVNGQIHFGSIGILPHPPALLLEFANFNRGIVLATGSFDFRGRTQGVIRLSDPICSGPSATNFTTAATPTSSVFHRAR